MDLSYDINLLWRDNLFLVYVTNSKCGCPDSSFVVCCRRGYTTLHARIVARLPEYMCAQQCTAQLHIHLHLLDCWGTTYQGYVEYTHFLRDLHLNPSFSYWFSVCNTPIILPRLQASCLSVWNNSRIAEPNFHRIWYWRVQLKFVDTC
jgi:hypothetical protein